MILGTGTDIVSLERIRRGYERFGARYAAHILSQAELPLLPGNDRAIAFLAGRWAAKEACAKALGTGFANGIGPGNLEVFNTATGAPELHLTGPALERLQALQGTRLHVSISHDTLCAVAFVIIEG